MIYCNLLIVNKFDLKLTDLFFCMMFTMHENTAKKPFLTASWMDRHQRIKASMVLTSQDSRQWPHGFLFDVQNFHAKEVPSRNRMEFPVV